ncbi:alginate O-acetyltransferase AlgX-related protein [Paraburkholderia sediminicola]|uniref:alginate O-acetyltransferase AlgX-related protein n=1 Tax=Paraburkholderia sediminicola TaxID=458836 RepID=UPI001C0B4AEE
MSKSPFSGRRQVLRAACALAVSAGLGLMAPALQAAPLVLEGKDGWLFPGWESLTDPDAGGLAAVIAQLRDTQTLLAAHDIGLVVIVAPMKARYYADRLPDGQALGPQVANRYKDMLAQLTAAGIKTVDLDAPVASISAGGHEPFFRGDYHWTAWSAEAAARTLAPVIRTNWKLTGAAGSGTVLGGWTEERRFGDLAELLPPERKKTVGKDLFTVRTTQAPGAAPGLLDDQPSPVHVVGNSFVQPYLGFTQMLSNQLDRPVGLSWNFGNVGPWATFLKYVESPEFTAHKPQVLVWQFNEGQFSYGPGANGKWDAQSIMSDKAWHDRVAAALAK